MKIHFAGSIRGGRDDKELYLEIINLLRKYGKVLFWCSILELVRTLLR